MAEVKPTSSSRPSSNTNKESDAAGCAVLWELLVDLTKKAQKVHEAGDLMKIGPEVAKLSAQIIKMVKASGTMFTRKNGKRCRELARRYDLMLTELHDILVEVIGHVGKAVCGLAEQKAQLSRVSLKTWVDQEFEEDEHQTVLEGLERLGIREVVDLANAQSQGLLAVALQAPEVTLSLGAKSRLLARATELAKAKVDPETIEANIARISQEVSQNSAKIDAKLVNMSDKLKSFAEELQVELDSLKHKAWLLLFFGIIGCGTLALLSAVAAVGILVGGCCTFFLCPISLATASTVFGAGTTVAVGAFTAASVAFIEAIKCRNNCKGMHEGVEKMQESVKEMRKKVKVVHRHDQLAGQHASTFATGGIHLYAEKQYLKQLDVFMASLDDVGQDAKNLLEEIDEQQNNYWEKLLTVQ